MPARFRPVLSQWLTQERPSDGATPLLLVWRNQLGAKNSSMLPRSTELQLCTKSAVAQAPALLSQGVEGCQVLDLIRCFVEHDGSRIVTPEPWPSQTGAGHHAATKGACGQGRLDPPASVGRLCYHGPPHREGKVGNNLSVQVLLKIVSSGPPGAVELLSRATQRPQVAAGTAVDRYCRSPIGSQERDNAGQVIRLLADAGVDFARLGTNYIHRLSAAGCSAEQWVPSPSRPQRKRSFHG